MIAWVRVRESWERSRVLSNVKNNSIFDTLIPTLLSGNGELVFIEIPQGTGRMR